MARDLPPFRRSLRRFAPALALGASGLAAACAGDGPMAPAAPAAGPALALTTTRVSTTTVGTTGGGGTTVAQSGTTVRASGDTSRVTVVIAPTATATITIGGHKLQVEAGSVCDPATSGYGAGTWDQSCRPITAPVTFAATSWTSADGHPVVTFTPDVRFVPGKVNTMWLLDPSAASRQAGVLAWCPTGGGACVDEGATDASLVTRYSASGYAYRRVKHLSGYTVVANRR